MPVTINGSTGVTAPAFDGALDGADITTGDIASARIATALNASGSAPIYACRAWVNFNGTGTISTNQTIRGSGNVASVFKNGTGDYTVTFTTAMPDANYAVSGMGSNNFSSFPPEYDIISMAAGSFRFQTKATGTSVVLQDPVFTTLVVFR